MEQQPLTNLGIATLIANLYALSQNELEVEIDALAFDFDSWIITHIQLNQSQQEYLLFGLPLEFKENLKLKLIDNLTHRNPIVFMKNENKPSRNAEGRGKLFGVEQQNTSTYNSDLGVIKEDTLSISINYSI